MSMIWVAKELERALKREAELEKALKDAVSTFQNDDNKKTMVTRERIEAWEEALKK